MCVPKRNLKNKTKTLPNVSLTCFEFVLYALLLCYFFSPDTGSLAQAGFELAV